MKEIKFSYIYQHDDTGRILNKKFDIHEIELELMGECFIEGYTLIARRQYTGLKDKNGKEVYEGDLIDLGYCIGKVVFDETVFGVPCFCIKNNMGYHDPFFAIDEYRKIWFEVIGTIYENPELLNDELKAE